MPCISLSAGIWQTRFHRTDCGENRAGVKAIRQVEEQTPREEVNPLYARTTRNTRISRKIRGLFATTCERGPIAIRYGSVETCGRFGRCSWGASHGGSRWFEFSAAHSSKPYVAISYVRLFLLKHGYDWQESMVWVRNVPIVPTDLRSNSPVMTADPVPLIRRSAAHTRFLRLHNRS
jgi:hypothetical protein